MPGKWTTVGSARTLVFAFLGMLAASAAARAEEPRRISVAIQPSVYFFDSAYFDLDPAFGTGVSMRYEIVANIFFENSIGMFTTKGGGVTVDGLDERLCAMALLPGLVSYRPVARLGIGFLSSNPVTVTPTRTFRPTQTTFYIVAGTGLARPVYARFLVEGGVNMWVTPYRYRIYTFDRENVTTRSESFTQLELQLSISYTF